jgi:cytochrome c
MNAPERVEAGARKEPTRRMASDLQFNKYAGALLATGLAILGFREVSNILFEPTEVEKPGYAIEVPESLLGGGEEAAELPPDWGTLLPTANTATGATLFGRCQSCHTIDQGAANGTGPNLFGAAGGPVAGHPGFAYSPALVAHKAEAPVWTYDELNEFLTAPQKHVPGTKMTFAGLRNVDDRVNLIAFLRTKTGSPPPIPAPDPSRQPGAQAATEAAAPAGAAGVVPAPAAGDSGTPPTAVGGGPAGQTPTATAPGGAPQAVQPSPGGEGGGLGQGSLRPGGGGTTGRTGVAASAQPAQNPAAANPQPTPRRNPQH